MFISNSIGDVYTTTSAVLVSKTTPRLPWYIGRNGKRLVEIAALRIRELQLRGCFSEINDVDICGERFFLADIDNLDVEVVKLGTVEATLEWKIENRGQGICPLARAYFSTCGNHE